MLDATASSTDNSPFSSPFQSPIVSPSSSRGTSPRSSRKISPVPSPKLQLRRANSYRKHSGKRGSSKLDDLIKKRNLLQRNRSQSDTDINGENTETKETVIMRRKKKSISQDFTERLRIRPDSTCSERSVDSRPGTPDRKKSLSQILDFRRIMELSPKLPRSTKAHSGGMKRAKTFSHADDQIEIAEGKDVYAGPLFQATTMFVPGYNFKTKQATSLNERPHSKSFLSRRGSKDKSLISLLEKVPSSPNLLRRGSRDKLDKHTVDQVKAKAKYTRCDSSPVTVTRTDSRVSMHQPMHRTGYSEDNLSELLSVSERSAIIAQKHKNFCDLKKPKYLEPEQPRISRGNVKKISITFEDGSIFVKKNLDPNDPQLGGFTKSFQSNRYSGEYDNIVRERAESFETGEVYRTNKGRSSYNYDNYSSDNYSSDVNRNGSESGYASPTESTASEASAPPQISITSESTDVLFNESWRRAGHWDDTYEQSQFLSPDIARVKLTELCVTEL